MAQTSKPEGHLAYVLARYGRELQCSLRWTRLLKWDAFSEIDLSDMKILFTKRYVGQLTPEDRSIVTGLMQFAGREGQWPTIDGDYGYELLRKMLETRKTFFALGSHKRLKWGDAIDGTLSWTPALGAESAWETRVELPLDVLAFPLNPPIYIDSATATCGLVATQKPPELTMKWLGARRMKAPDVSNFCLRLAKEFPEATFPTPECARMLNSDAKPVAILTIQQRAITEKRERDEAWIDLRDRLRLRLRFQYGRAVAAWDSAEGTLSYREDGLIKRVARDKAWESSAMSVIEAWGFSADDQLGDLDLFNFDSSTFSLRSGASWRRLLEKVFPALDDSSWKVESATGLTIAIATDADLIPAIKEEGDDQYSMSLDLSIDGRREPLLPVLHRALRRQPKSTFSEVADWLQGESFALNLSGTDNGSTRLAVLPNDALARYADQLHELFDRNPFDSAARTRLNRWRLGELASAGLVDESCAAGLSAVVRLCERIGSGIAVQERQPPKNLNTKLRDYQRMGLGWLKALEDVGASGILADDMGLGKTAQTIAHLLDLKQSGRLKQGALVVAPTSVLDNWVEEIQRFAPDLTFTRFHGKDRVADWAASRSRDALLTTYSILRLDAERLQSRHWDLAILDEAQFIKNPAARTAVAARGLRATRRLCLTGTPIENRLEDVWSLFEFLLPGFLGDENTFRARIAQPLEDAEDATLASELRERLKRRLRPFVLRRVKADVLNDLPERTEVVDAVAMNARQRDLYDSYRKEARERIRNSLAVEGIGGARMLILSRLLRLRQICCDPRLIDDGRATFSASDSAKLQALFELLRQLVEQGSRVLVFSQFTSMLDLIADALRYEGYDFLMLTGRTQDRAKVVQQFQDGDAPVFLLSLRAGGAGLNLTAADCVIHYDPWWNPAVERQANDRAYRIGQDKPVFVYKLIADDSIESRIQRLQRNKLALVEDLLAEGNIDRLAIDSDTIDYLFGD